MRKTCVNPYVFSGPFSGSFFANKVMAYNVANMDDIFADYLAEKLTVKMMEEEFGEKFTNAEHFDEDKEMDEFWDASKSDLFFTLIHAEQRFPSTEEDGDFVVCSECGAKMLLPHHAELCPCCGAKGGTLQWIDEEHEHTAEELKERFDLIRIKTDLKRLYTDEQIIEMAR